MLFGVKVNPPFNPTSTLVLRRPPTGRPSGGDVLGVDAFAAFCLKASKVFPELGLPSGQIKIAREERHSTYALIE
jgi:hypothetical protein